MKCIHITISIVENFIGYEKLFFYTENRFLECVTFVKKGSKELDLWVNDDEQLIISPNNKFGKNVSLKESFDLISESVDSQDDDASSNGEKDKLLGKHAFYKEPLAELYYGKKIEYILDVKDETELILEYHPLLRGVNVVGRIIDLKKEPAAELDYKIDITDINKFFLKYTFCNLLGLVAVYIIGGLLIMEDQAFEIFMNTPVEHKTYGSIVALLRLSLLFTIVIIYIAGFIEYIRIKLYKRPFKEYINERQSKRNKQLLRQKR